MQYSGHLFSILQVWTECLRIVCWFFFSHQYRSGRNQPKIALDSIYLIFYSFLFVWLVGLIGITCESVTNFPKNRLPIVITLVAPITIDRYLKISSLSKLNRTFSIWLVIVHFERIVCCLFRLFNIVQLTCVMCFDKNVFFISLSLCVSVSMYLCVIIE